VLVRLNTRKTFNFLGKICLFTGVRSMVHLTWHKAYELSNTIYVYIERSLKCASARESGRSQADFGDCSTNACAVFPSFIIIIIIISGSQQQQDPSDRRQRRRWSPHHRIVVAAHVATGSRQPPLAGRRRRRPCTVRDRRRINPSRRRPSSPPSAATTSCRPVVTG